MAIRVIFTPHNEATNIFEQADNDILIISPNIKSSFMNFIDNVSMRKKLRPRLITSIRSESGTEWDRERSFSDYPELLERHEERKWEIRVARFSLRAYCIDGRIVVISTVNPLHDGRIPHGGLWIVFEDPVSSTPFVQLFEYFWYTAKDLKASIVAEALKEKGQEIGPFLDLPPDLPGFHTFRLAEEVLLEKARNYYETSPSDDSLKEYLCALEPFDRPGTERINVIERYLSTYGDSASAYQYLAHLHFQRSNYQEAYMSALKALAKNKDDMDMVSILIVTTGASDLEKASNIALQYIPENVSDNGLLTQVVAVLKASLKEKPNAKVASVLLRAYRCLYDRERSKAKEQIRQEADELAKQYGWKLGW